MYTVKNDIPPPTDGPLCRYPWGSMQPGSRFDLPIEGEPGGAAGMKNRIRSSFASWRTGRPSRAGLRIKVETDSDAGLVRVWMAGERTAADAPFYRAEPIRWPFDAMRRPEPETIPNAGTAHGHAAAVAEFERVARCARQNFRRWRAADPARAGLQFQIYADGRAGRIMAWVTGSKAEAAHARDTWSRLTQPTPPPMVGFPPVRPAPVPVSVPAAPKPATVPAAPAAPAVASADPEPGSEATDFGDW
jgi:hypothetical protein